MVNIQSLYDRATYNSMRFAPLLAKGFSPKLRQVCVEITNNCDLRCKICNLRNSKRPFGYMDLVLYRKVVSEFKDLGVDILHLNFEGESFLHPNIKEFLELSLDSGAKYRQLFSNGMLVKPYLETIARCLTKITFSLDGLGAVNDGIRLGCKYDVIFSNIKALKEIRQSIGSPLQIWVNMTNYTQTETEIADFRAEMSRLVDRVTIAEYRDTLNHYQKKGLDMRSGVAKPVRKAHYCAYPLNTLVVLWNGDISFCQCAVTTMPPMLPFNAYCNTLSEIWDNSIWRKMRYDSFKLGHPPYPECVDCDIIKELR